MFLLIVLELRMSAGRKIRSPKRPMQIEAHPSIPNDTTGLKGDTSKARNPNIITKDQETICRAVKR